MSETLRIERARNEVVAILKSKKRSFSQTELRNLLADRLKGDFRESDLRAAIWQLVDGGRAKFTGNQLIEIADMAVAAAS